MAKLAMKLKQQKKQKFSTREYSRCKSVVVHMLISESTEFVEYVSVS